MYRTALLATCASIAIAAAMPALAADPPRPPAAVVAPVKPLPAVSGPNGKIGAFGGSIDGFSGWGVQGAFSVPLHQQWGLQVDGLAGSAGGEAFWGTGGHLFWRDPARGLFGAYASWVDWNNIGASVGKIGFEAEWYAGKWSLEGMAASQFGTFSGFTGTATVAFYAHDNLRLAASYRHLQGIGNIGTVGAEWQHQNSGLAVFGNGSWGQTGYKTLLAGVKFYHGPQKSLIRRHREDDPGIGLPLDLFACVSGLISLDLRIRTCDGISAPF